MTKEERKDTNWQEHHFNSLQIALKMESESQPVLSARFLYISKARKIKAATSSDRETGGRRGEGLLYDICHSCWDQLEINSPEMTVFILMQCRRPALIIRGVRGSHSQVRFTVRPPDQYGKLI